MVEPTVIKTVYAFYLMLQEQDPEGAFNLAVLMLPSQIKIGNDNS